MFLTRLMENSAAVRLIKKVSSGSRIIALCGSFAEITRRIFAGSRVVSFFKVGDYLEVDSSPLASLVKNSKNCRKISNLILPCINHVRSWTKKLHPDQSALVSLIAETKRQREKILTRKNILYFGLVFLAIFYILRFLLLAFIPEGNSRISWPAGFLLTLILISLLLQLTPKNHASSSVSSSPGILQNTGRAFIWLAVKTGRSGKFLVEIAIKLIQSRRSGGNRGSNSPGKRRLR